MSIQSPMRTQLHTSKLASTTITSSTIPTKELNKLVENLSQYKIAIICDWLKDWGGAEQVLYDMLEVIPHADIFSSIFHPKNFPELEHRKVQTTFLDRIPLLRSRPKMIPFLRPYAFESLDLRGYDIVISSSSAESKGVITQPETVHVCYCHTPTRYYWSHSHEYAENPDFGWLNPLAKLVIPWLFHKLRIWDRLASDRVDTFIANSATTAARIQKYYRRDSTIVHPGIDETEYVLGGTKKDYYFALGRIIPYKRFDLIVDAFNENGLPLIICSNTDSALVQDLKARSKSNITWTSTSNIQVKVRLLQEAKALIFPGEEDFGMVPIESMLCGTPVIAYGKGGALETVKDGISGTFFIQQNIQDLNLAIERFDSSRFSPARVREHALQFSRKNFQYLFLKEVTARKSAL